MSYACNPSTCRLTLEHCRELKTSLGCAQGFIPKKEKRGGEGEEEPLFTNYTVDGTKALLSGKAQT